MYTLGVVSEQSNLTPREEGVSMNRIDLEGRRAVVTGAAQGIGLAVARRFLESGAEVVVWDVNQAAMDKAARLTEGVAGISTFATVMNED